MRRRESIEIESETEENVRKVGINLPSLQARKTSSKL
jgi:hypothetical protein